MNYCIHLKKRKNKPYCNIMKKEIPFSRCQECGNKEYKTKTKEISLYKKKKCTEFTENDTFKENLSPKNTKKVQNIKIKSNSSQIRNSAYSLHNSAEKLHKMKNKSNKLAKLERNRFSVFTDDDKCFVCGSTYQLTWNEIYRGKNRPNSMQDGFCLRMCLDCHRKYQDDVAFNEFWHREAQLFYEKNIGSRKQFLARYRRNYLE